MHFHPLLYLKRSLFRLGNYPEISRFFLCGQRYRSKTLSVMPWLSQTFKIKSITECFLGSGWQIHLDRHRVNTWINFRSSQLPFSLKEQLIWEALANGNNKFSNKQLDIFIKYFFRPILLRIFAAVKASLIVIYNIVVKNIIFTFQKELLEGVAKYILLK